MQRGDVVVVVKGFMFFFFSFFCVNGVCVFMVVQSRVFGPRLREVLLGDVKACQVCLRIHIRSEY